MGIPMRIVIGGEATKMAPVDTFIADRPNMAVMDFDRANPAGKVQIQFAGVVFETTREMLLQAVLGMIFGKIPDKLLVEYDLNKKEVNNV